MIKKVLVHILFSLVLSYIAYAKSIDYSEYINLEDNKKEKLIKKHVKLLKDGRFTVNISNYQVYSDASAEIALRYAILMDHFHRRFKKIFKKKFKITKRPKLFVMKDQKSYSASIYQFTNGRINAGWSAGMYVYFGNKRALFGNMRFGEKQLISTLFHEGTHQLLHSYIGHNIPIWFNEGIATNFQTWQIERSVKQNVSRALFLTRYHQALKEIYPNRGYVHFEKLSSISSKEWLEASKPQANYASAWVAINAMLSTTNGKKFFNNMIKGLRAGKSFKKIMPLKTRKKFLTFLENYIKDTITPHQKYSIKIEKSLKNNSFDTAEKEVLEFYFKHSDNPYAKFYHSLLLISKKQDLTIANKTLLKLNQSSPVHPDLDFALAISYKAIGNYSKSLIHLKKKLRNDPNHSKSQRLMLELKQHKP